MTFDGLMIEIGKLENPYSDGWWPQVATLVKIFSDETDDAGRKQVTEWLEDIERQAKEGGDLPEVMGF